MRAPKCSSSSCIECTDIGWYRVYNFDEMDEVSEKHFILYKLEYINAYIYGYINEWYRIFELC